ncbi:MAG: hypothetical protein E3J21_05065 [Anaerolineales bacterium]|nr:MAG: hypothetical protein E3J21_05065 [Anaerolineales bacterium]
MADQPKVYHRRVAADEWIDAVDGFKDKVKFIYAEEPADLHLTNYRRPQASWTHGRAFGPTLEVRWSHRRDGQVDLLLLTESEPCPQGWEPITVAEDEKPLEVDAAEESTVMLVGMHRRHLASTHRKAGQDVPHEWIETRIPRPLVYPLDETPDPERWARLKVRVYRVAERPVLTRMVDVEGTNDVQRL